MNRIRLNLLLLIALLSFRISAQTLEETPYFGTNPGNLSMYHYSPGNILPGDKCPLVVVLHGCSQSAQLVSEQTGWNRLADTYGFRVLYPQQKASNNPSMCFNWYRSGDIDRDRGECASIKQMMEEYRKNFVVDSSRVFITGLSAGAAMAVVMMATNPADFRAGASFAGGPYKAVVNILATASGMLGWINRSPEEWGALVRDANPAYNGPFPQMIIYQGKRDIVVNHKSAHELIEQWTNVYGIDTLADDTVKDFADNVNIRKYIYHDDKGKERLLYYEVKNIGHSLLVNPGNCRDEGGKMVSFSSDEDFFSTYWTAIDFGLIPRPEITGKTEIKEGEQDVEYSVPLNNGSGYSWSYPDDARAVGPENTNILKLNFGKREGRISVVENDSAGCYFRYPSLKVKMKP